MGQKSKAPRGSFIEKFAVMPLFRRFKRIGTLSKGEGEGDEELAMSNEQLVMSYEG